MLLEKNKEAIMTNNSKSIATMLQVLKDDISNDEGYIYSRSLLKNISFHKNPMEIRFIDVIGKGFYYVDVNGSSINNAFRGLMALHCNYTINFDYFSKVMKLISDIAYRSYSIKRPLKQIELMDLNWQDASIRHVIGSESRQYQFNSNGLHTVFDGKKISYDVEPTMIKESSSINGCIGYFEAINRQDSCSGFVMRMQCSFGAIATYEFYVSLDESNPFILMESGTLVSEQVFSTYLEQHLYKMIYRNFLTSGVGPGTIGELKKFTQKEMKDLVQLHDMVKL